MSLPIEETITELGNCDKPLLNSRLIELSNLNSEELELLEQAWAVIEPKRRRQIIYRLVELKKLRLSYTSRVCQALLTVIKANLERRALEAAAP